jgi:hypothetical protein
MSDIGGYLIGRFAVLIEIKLFTPRKITPQIQKNDFLYIR